MYKRGVFIPLLGRAWSALPRRAHNPTATGPRRASIRATPAADLSCSADFTRTTLRSTVFAGAQPSAGRPLAGASCRSIPRASTFATSSWTTGTSGSPPSVDPAQFTHPRKISDDYEFEDPDMHGAQVSMDSLDQDPTALRQPVESLGVSYLAKLREDIDMWTQGRVTPSEFQSRLKSATVAELLESKKLMEGEASVGSNLWIRSDATVLEAIRLMASEGVGALLVMDMAKLDRNQDGFISREELMGGAGSITGIFTERDYLTRVALKGHASASTPVSAVMSCEMILVPPNTSVRATMDHMVAHGIRHLPVVEGDSLLGMVSIRDVVRRVVEEDKAEIHNLEKIHALEVQELARLEGIHAKYQVADRELQRLRQVVSQEEEEILRLHKAREMEASEVRRLREVVESARGTIAALERQQRRAEVEVATLKRIQALEEKKLKELIEHVHQDECEIQRLVEFVAGDYSCSTHDNNNANGAGDDAAPTPPDAPSGGGAAPASKEGAPRKTSQMYRDEVRQLHSLHAATAADFPLATGTI